MRLARARWRSRTVLVRLDGGGGLRGDLGDLSEGTSLAGGTAVNGEAGEDGGAPQAEVLEGVVLASESDHPAADVLREALWSSMDLSGPGIAQVTLAELDLLSPVANPSKLLAVGDNYAEHADEMGDERPSAPLLFLKAPSAIVGPMDAVTFDLADSTEVDFEAELAVVIGRRCRNVPVEGALDCVLGYTLCNDVSARDAQFKDGQWMRGKSFDTFAPLGPWIVTRDEIPTPVDLGITCRVNGQVMQASRTSWMTFGVAELVSYASRFMTLEPGDVISTGTPTGTGFARKPPVFLHDGDVVEVEVEKVGVLTSTVRAVALDGASSGSSRTV